MTEGVADSKIIKASLCYRAKYKTKRQAVKQNLMCWQLVPHPSNRGGEPRRTAKTKALAGDIIEVGYDPLEGIADRVAVEVELDASGDPSHRFSQHFQANSGMGSDH